MSAEPGNARTPDGPRNVLVTGGSRGIGQAIAERFGRTGDRVWLTYRSSAERAKAFVAELTAAGAQAEAFEFDQGNWSSHVSLLGRLPGPVDVLVNNAAVGTRSVEDYVQGAAHEKDAAILRINGTGPLWLVSQILPGMIERGGPHPSAGGGLRRLPRRGRHRHAPRQHARGAAREPARRTDCRAAARTSAAPRGDRGDRLVA